MEWIRPLLTAGSTVEDGLMAMAICRDCRIDLAPSAGLPLETLAALTWNGGAEAVAEIWPDRDAEPSRAFFWYGLFPERPPTGTPHDVARDRYDRARRP